MSKAKIIQNFKGGKPNKVKDPSYRMIINTLLPAIHLSQKDSFNDKTPIDEDSTTNLDCEVINNHTKDKKDNKGDYQLLLDTLLPALSLSESSNKVANSKVKNETINSRKNFIKEGIVAPIIEYNKIMREYKEEKKQLNRVTDKTSNKIINTYAKSITNSTLKLLMLQNEDKSAYIMALKSLLVPIPMESINNNEGNLKWIQLQQREALKGLTYEQIIWNLFIAIKEPQLLSKENLQAYYEVFNSSLINANKICRTKANMKLDGYSHFGILGELSVLYTLFLSFFLIRGNSAGAVKILLYLKYNQEGYFDNKYLLLDWDTGLNDTLLDIIPEPNIYKGNHDPNNKSSDTSITLTKSRCKAFTYLLQEHLREPKVTFNLCKRVYWNIIHQELDTLRNVEPHLLVNFQKDIDYITLYLKNEGSLLSAKAILQWYHLLPKECDLSKSTFNTLGLLLKLNRPDILREFVQSLIKTDFINISFLHEQGKRHLYYIQTHKLSKIEQELLSTYFKLIRCLIDYGYNEEAQIVINRLFHNGILFYTTNGSNNHIPIHSDYNYQKIELTSSQFGLDLAYLWKLWGLHTLAGSKKMAMEAFLILSKLTSNPFFFDNSNTNLKYQPNPQIFKRFYALITDQPLPLPEVEGDAFIIAQDLEELKNVDSISSLELCFNFDELLSIIESQSSLKLVH